MYRELLLGCGARLEKERSLPTAMEIRANHEYVHGAPRNLSWQGLVTLDINIDHKPHIFFNLERIDGQACNRIPDPSGVGKCPPNYFDEVHAYEVLEHIGRQGDHWKFFAQFEEFHRIMKPDALLFATCPSWSSLWAWGDPSHTRIINSGTLAFLSQAQYREQVGRTAMTDFRYCYKADFEPVFVVDDGETFRFVLRALK